MLKKFFYLFLLVGVVWLACLCFMYGKAHAKDTSWGYEASIIRTINGSMLEASDKDNCVHRIKLYGINAPTMEYKEGLAAQKFLDNLAVHKVVTVYVYYKDKDNTEHGVVIPSNAEPLNQTMLLYGQAFYDEKNCDRWFCSRFRNFENEAKLLKYGMWKKGGNI